MKTILASIPDEKPTTRTRTTTKHNGLAFATSGRGTAMRALFGKGLANIRRLQRQRFLLIGFAALWFHGPLWAQDRGKIARPVDSSRSFESSTFQASYDHVWQLLFKMLSDYRFEFVVKDKNVGRLETNYVIFSRNPHFSKLSNGVKSLATTPRAFLRKWVDGRIRVFAEVQRIQQNSTKVILRPDIYGFSSTLADDSGVTGEWRQCSSSGKFEFELFNELATSLRKEGSMNPPEVTEVLQRPEVVPKTAESASSTLVVSSAPEGAEILLDNQLVGMTPSRLTVPPGSHKVVFRKKGYKDFEKDFVILKDSDLTVSAEMEKR
jgi:hypothetical protein